MSVAQFDVAVLGGGPAGAVLARQLTALDLSVALVSVPRRFKAIEGLAERAWRGLEFAGCDAALAEVGAEVPRDAYWNGVRFDGNRERVVDRRAFDEALLRDVARAGVNVFAGRVGAPAHCGDRWHIRWPGAVQEVGAAFVADARGRAAPRRGARWRRGPATVSVGQVWTGAAGLPAATRVATFGDGWLWFASAGDGRAVVQLFLSVESQPLPPRTALQDYYSHTVNATEPIRELLGAARPAGALHVRDAGTSACEQSVAGRFARLGDAALAIDPLAGHGMYEAVSGALALAPVINTVLRRPDNAALAAAFYRDKLAHDFLRMARIGRDFYREETRWPATPFWHERQRWPDEAPAHAAPAASAPRIESRPVSAAGFIVEREVVVTADHPRGIWRVAGVPLAELLALVRESHADLTQRAVARFHVDLQTAGAAIAWLAARGLLR